MSENHVPIRARAQRFPPPPPSRATALLRAAQHIAPGKGQDDLTPVTSTRCRKPSGVAEAAVTAGVAVTAGCRGAGPAPATRWGLGTALRAGASPAPVLRGGGLGFSPPPRPDVPAPLLAVQPCAPDTPERLVGSAGGRTPPETPRNSSEPP